MCICKKNRQSEEALGRSCGGFSTKIHGVCDALGNPIAFVLTPGQASDHTKAKSLIDGLQFTSLLADKGYDSNELRSFVISKGSCPEIPPRANRIVHLEYDEHIYKERHKIECLFGFLKHYRRIFSRFDKYASRFSAFLHFLAALQWLK